MYVKLSRAERIIVRKIARVQIQNLNLILENNIEEDLSLYLAINEIPKEDFFMGVKNDIEVFENLRECPGNFLAMGEENTSLIKHILFNYFNKPKYKEGKTKVWKKLLLMEKINFSLN